MGQENTAKFCFTPEALQIVRSFTPEEHQAFLALHGAMQSAEKVRGTAEARGIRIVTMLFALCMMTFLVLFLVAVIGIPRTAYHAHVQTPLFSWAFFKEGFINTAIVLVCFLPFIGLCWLTIKAGVLLGRFTGKVRIQQAYQSVAACIQTHRAYIAQPLRLLRMMNEPLCNASIRWAILVGGLQSDTLWT